MNDPLLFKGSDNIDMLREIEKFRLTVWSRVIDAKTASERFGMDQFDHAGWHVAYRDQGKIIASGRLIVVTEQAAVPDLCSFGPYVERMHFPIGILNRLVVHWEHSGNGLGRRLNVERLELAARHGAAEVWVEVQSGRVPSMQRLGFEEVGPSQDTTIVGDWRIMRRSA
ncbi:MAG: GNAT family N-acetyltransferase [Thiogranum sp.]|jgi:predicted GNAT family N-acyltransferase